MGLLGRRRGLQIAVDRPGAVMETAKMALGGCAFLCCVLELFQQQEQQLKDCEFWCRRGSDGKGSFTFPLSFRRLVLLIYPPHH